MRGTGKHGTNGARRGARQRGLLRRNGAQTRRATPQRQSAMPHRQRATGPKLRCRGAGAQHSKPKRACPGASAHRRRRNRDAGASTQRLNARVRCPVASMQRLNARVRCCLARPQRPEAKVRCPAARRPKGDARCQRRWPRRNCDAVASAQRPEGQSAMPCRRRATVPRQKGDAPITRVCDTAWRAAAPAAAPCRVRQRACSAAIGCALKKKAWRAGSSPVMSPAPERPRPNGRARTWCPAQVTSRSATRARPAAARFGTL